MVFSEREGIILDGLQRGLPPVEDPFTGLAHEIGISQEELLETVTSLKAGNIIRNISGIFSGEALGFFLSLVALKVPPDRIDEVGAFISSHPGVSHNYVRNHDYNMWFTLAEENEDFFYHSLSVIKKKTGIEDSLVLRKEKLFKIGVLFKVGRGESGAGEAFEKGGGDVVPESLSPREVEAIRLLQRDLPVKKNPFEALLRENNSFLSLGELLDLYSSFLERKIMRRYCAVLKHRNAGYRANSMTVWKPGSNFDLDVFMQSSAVSHLYTRTVYPGKWEYPLFAMIHSKTESELADTVEELFQRSGAEEFISLQSVRELKKQRVCYFSPEFSKWKGEHYD